jgi:glycosyltransferase involved in cell wall biosynthesis
MRVGISTLMIQRGRTGVAQYLFSLLRAFQQLDGCHEFTLFVLEADLPLFEFAQGGMRLVPVSERNRPPVRNILWHQGVLPGLVRQLDLRVLHVPSYRRLLARRPCALVATIHDLAPFRVVRKYDWKRMLYGRVVARRLAFRQDRVIAVSHNTASDLRCFFRLPADRIRVIHNGLDHARFHPDPGGESRSVAAKKFGLSCPFFLYVARLEHPGKNHLRLISAFERFKSSTGSGWQLVFGGSDWHGAERIHEARERSPYRQDVRSLGFVPETELPGLYRAAGAFVYPSLYEGFGLPPLEAMACGCPVIASTRGSLGEVVGGAARTVDPESIDDLARALCRVATDETCRRELSAAGLVRAAQFDWHRTARATLKVYEETVRQAPAPDFLPGPPVAVGY